MAPKMAPKINRHEAGRARLRLVALLGVGAWMLLAGRLVQVQGLQHSELALKAKAQHGRWRALSANRGRILDRRGREMALDVQSVSFYCNPALVERPDEVAQYFAALRGTDSKVLRRQLKSSQTFLYLARQVDGRRLAEFPAPDFKGVYQHAGTTRYYPYAHLAAQLVGFTDIDNQGREGLELAYTSALTATEGRALSFVDGRGRALPGREEQRQPPVNGSSVRLTIDAVYQDVLEEELLRAMEDSGSENALGIVSDPRTGEILAMASVPGFDPNDPGASGPQLRRNRTVTDSFEPGSTLKAIMAAAVLDQGRANAETQVFCENGLLELANGDPLRDLSPNGWLTSREVLEKSSNIGAVKLARKLERHEFYGYMRSFGFGTRTGIGLPAESAGLLRHTSEWSNRSLDTIAIGQEISVTAIQMVQAFGAIANGGVLMAPLIVREVKGSGGQVESWMGPQIVRRVVSAKTARVMRSILTGVVERGSGIRARISGVSVAGKTGTAQRARADGSGYADDEAVVSFIGFLPADDPQFLCLVALDNPRRSKWGGQTAAPAFKRAMERIYALGVEETLEPNGAGVLTGPLNGARNSLSAVPDLRGMTESLARYHCGLRGLTVRFDGSGSTVVSQDPAPGGSGSGGSGSGGSGSGGSGSGGREVTCVLDRPEFAPVVDLAATPLRQALLLRQLGDSRLALFHP
jgi:cell division protein FtsI (penicillin-binding protein 3)